MRYRGLLKYALRRWPPFAVIIVLTLLTSALSVLQPWPLKLLIDFALGDAALPMFLGFVDQLPVSRITALLLLAAGASATLFVLNSLLEIGMSCSWASYGDGMVYDLAAELFYKLQRTSLLSHGRRTVGDSLSRLTGDAYCLIGLVQSLLSPIQNLLTLVSVGLIAWRLDPGLAALTLVIAPVQVVAGFFFGGRLKRRAQQSRKTDSSLLTFVHQTLTAIPLVQAFGTEARNGQQFRRMAADAVALSQRGVLLGNAYNTVNGLTNVLINAFVIYIGAQRVLNGAVSTGSLLVFISYMSSMRGALTALLSTYASVKPLEVKIERVLEVLDSDSELRDAPGAAPFPTGIRGHVQIEHVTFGYESDRPVLRDISLEARPGEVVALVGATGAGKSTLVSLIPRFFDPWEGRVTVDGIDLRHVQLASLRRHIGLLLQEPFLLPLTIAENIAYGRPEASREEVIEAAMAANADVFIQRLPAGYDTPIGERGATLSGGEKQRIAIARALLKDAPIVILDEPTSALDAETEALLLEGLERLMLGRSTFIIAHRLSTIRNADRIAVIDNGQIVETGVHAQLLANKGPYYRFHSLQTHAYASEVAE